MKTPLIEKLTEYRVESGLSYDKLGDKTGISASTICRWYKGQGVPSLDEIELLCEAMGHDISDIFVTVGKQEMVATQSIGYQGANAMVEHYEARLAAKDELYRQLQGHHSQRMEQENAHHEKQIAYYDKEIERLRGVVASLTAKKNIVFWVLVGIIVLLLIALSLALGTNALY